jgi:DNA-directed RNA polymerase specialized sigma24 family protein
MEALPDEHLLAEGAKSGDSQAFTQLYDATLEDLTSQVFLKAWEKLDRGRAVCHRSQRGDRPLPDTAALLVVQAARPEVLLLRFMDEVDTAQIVRRLGKSQDAIRAFQMQGLQALAKLMDIKDRQQVQE